MNEDSAKALYQAAVAKCWRTGNLQYKTHSSQLQIYKAIHAQTAREHFLLCSRRLGKSFLLVLLSFEQALRFPQSRVLYLAPWAKDAAEIATDLVQTLLEDCPEDLKPKYNSQTKEYLFNNGSLIRFKGTNGEHAQFLRGGSAHVVVLDECGLMDDLRHVYLDVVSPMTLTTQGRVYFATTPPVTPDHESASLFEQMAGKGAASVFTIREAPHIPRQEKLSMLVSMGEKAERVEAILDGVLEPDTTTAQREFFCKFVTDASRAVVPEFSGVKKDIILVPKRPAYFDCYVSMDPGVVDRTGVLYAYWDFQRSKIVIEDESLLQRKNTNDIAREIKVKEEALWGFQKPYRYSDIQLQLIIDLYQLHHLTFYPVQKENSLGAINLMRTMIQGKQIEIHPQCVNLIRQLENAVWNSRASDFDRSDLHGHYDLVAALKYLCRHVMRSKNPFPEGYFEAGGGGGPPAQYHVPFNPQRKRRRSKRLGSGLLPDTPTGRKIGG